MTTPERVRRRQRIETTLLALVLIGGGVTAVILDRQNDRYGDCLVRYIAADSETTQIRSSLVRDESEATRTIIRRVFAADTAEESLAAYADYKVSLARIDKIRASNPVQEFDQETCQWTNVLGTVPWFDQSYADAFYYTKGLVAVISTLLVVGHMMHTWDDVTTWGRRLRYFALLGCTALMSFASVEQLDESADVSYRNLGALAVLCLVIWAMCVSIREDLRRPVPKVSDQ